MGKKTKKHEQSESEELQDVMAWGNSKNNYYKQSQDQYESASQEEKQINQIYQRQANAYQNDDAFEIPPDANESEMEDSKDQPSQGLNQSYLSKEIQTTLKTGLSLETYQSTNQKKIFQKYLNSYLLIMISLKELKIPYIQHHPIVKLSFEIRQKVHAFKKYLKKKEETHEEVAVQENHFHQDQFENDNQFNQEINENQEYENQSNAEDEDDQEEGLKIYEKTRREIEEKKNIKKNQKRKERQLNKKPAFSELKGNEGRLASEKILKNKGLMKKRKKIDGNGRVKLKNKFKKAQSKQRSKGHFIRENPGRGYQGEANVKIGKIASVKLK